MKNPATSAWPALPLAEWEPTYLTLHRWTQIVGKLRIAHAPWMNHWWHVTFPVTAQGLESDMPAGAIQLTLTFDFCAHRLVAHASDGRTASFALEPMSVAAFFAKTRGLLARFGVETPIWPVPVEVVDATPFDQDETHSAYDSRAVEKLHRILLQADRVFRIHRGRFLGKSSPVHFFWGAFDLAVTRFSGRRNPDPPKDFVMREAYSHEVISHGFWPGGDWPASGRTEEPVFYAYASPEPAGFKTARFEPDGVRYSDSMGILLLPYDAVRTAPDPDATLLGFMESTYLAAATRAGWDIEALRHPHEQPLGQPLGQPGQPHGHPHAAEA
jgi:hypothetical protein